MQVLYQAELHPDNAIYHIPQRNKKQCFFILEYMHIAPYDPTMYYQNVRTQSNHKTKGNKKCLNMMTNNANANTVAMFNQQIATKNQVEKRKNRAHNTPAWIQPVCF